jgi:hypothetical protein
MATRQVLTYFKFRFLKRPLLDLAARSARKVERVPQEVIDDAIGRLMALLD